LLNLELRVSRVGILWLVILELCTWYLKLRAARALLPIAGEGRLQAVEKARRPELAEEIFVRGGWVDRERGLVSGDVVNGLSICDRRKRRAWGALGVRRI
jgi:hypothetical protein